MPAAFEKRAATHAGRVVCRALLLAIVWLYATQGFAREPLKDYSFIRGANHEMTGDLDTLRRQLGYARRVDINSVRVWLDMRAYEARPQAYIEKVKSYIRVANGMGISTMPILFNGNGLDPAILSTKSFPRAERYVAAIVGAIRQEPGLLMWDVMNEPFTNDYHDGVTGTLRDARETEITAFIRHFLTFTRQVDSTNALTIGYTFSTEMSATADLVDVLSFHDYSETRAQIESAYREAEKISANFGKPVLNTETGCIARANSYDSVIAIANEHKTGFYIFNLIIAGNWAQVHGIFYADGTIRDPATIAALLGFQRNRNLAKIIPPRANREGSASRALEKIETALAEKSNPFAHVETSTNTLLDAAEHAANLLEAAEGTPMAIPPTARIGAWRAQSPQERNVEEIRTFVYSLGLELKRQVLSF